MGREVKRVALDFDWPVGTIWPGYMARVCDEEIAYCVGRKSEAARDWHAICAMCRHAGRLAKRPITVGGCPNWRHEPPDGPGWQMWETTTEGSPISPVMESPEALADWLVEHNASASGDSTATREQWLAMIRVGWAPSFVADSDGVRSGVADCANR